METSIVTLAVNITNFSIGMAPVIPLAHFPYQQELKAQQDQENSANSLELSQAIFTGMEHIKSHVQALSNLESLEIEISVIITAHPPASIIGMDLALILVSLLLLKDQMVMSSIVISHVLAPNFIIGIQIVLQTVLLL